MKNIIEKLKRLEQESISRGIPIVGSEKGMFLLSKVQEIKPKKILELGTANGYSGCILGSEAAELITIDIDEQISLEAEKNFQKFGIHAHRIIGEAVEEVKKLILDKQNLESFDLIFIDFSKKEYIKVLEDCIKLVRKDGLIIADNITFEGCQNYREKVLNHPKLKTEIIDIKDGLACSKRIK